MNLEDIRDCFPITEKAIDEASAIDGITCEKVPNTLFHWTVFGSIRPKSQMPNTVSVLKKELVRNR